MADISSFQTLPADRSAELVRAYQGPVRRFLARRIGGGPEVDDLVQEVFARLFRRDSGAPVENLEGYLFQIAANLLRERGRRAAVRNGAAAVDLDPELLGESEEPSPERILMGQEAYRTAIAALHELPERTRTVFILSRFEDMTGAEIARRLGISASAVEKQMMRALSHLRARLR